MNGEKQNDDGAVGIVEMGGDDTFGWLPKFQFAFLFKKWDKFRRSFFYYYCKENVLMPLIVKISLSTQGRPTVRMEKFLK